MGKIEVVKPGILEVNDNGDLSLRHWGVNLNGEDPGPRNVNAVAAIRDFIVDRLNQYPGITPARARGAGRNHAAGRHGHRTRSRNACLYHHQPGAAG